MKKSTKIAFQGLFEMIAVPFSIIILWTVLSYIRPNFWVSGNTFASIFGILTSIIAIMYYFKGYSTLQNSKSLKTHESSNPYYIGNSKYADFDRKKIRHLIKRVCKLGNINTIYECEIFSIVNFNDMFYLLCPYSANVYDEPFGLKISPKLANTMINDNFKMAIFISSLDDVAINSISVSIAENNFDYLKELCKNPPQKEIAEKSTDKKLEWNLYLKRISCFYIYFSIASFAFASLLFIWGIGFGIFSFIAGIYLICKSIKIKTKIQGKIKIGFILSCIFIILTVISLPHLIHGEFPNYEDEAYEYSSKDDIKIEILFDDITDFDTQYPDIREHIKTPDSFK